MNELTTHHYQALLGLDSNWRVTSVEFRPQDRAGDPDESNPVVLGFLERTAVLRFGGSIYLYMLPYGETFQLKLLTQLK
ncbi:MAG: hypothetical protein SGI77_18555 [Pirellulaceae bacterium]|nr:hypothetical protein [Pirellulaceae bacterium]